MDRMAEQMLGVQKYPFEQSPYSETPKTDQFTRAAKRAGIEVCQPNLAVTFARQGDLRVAAVDGRRERAAVAQLLGLADSPGLQEALSGRALLAHALRPTAQANLTPTGKYGPLDPWAYKLIHQSGQSGPLITEHSAGQNTTDQPGVTGKYGPLDPGIAAVIRT